jgi:alpha-amylase/alpha-mannosidase (GH57 family)
VFQPERDPLDKYVCVHGHFYQPPRENPWLETVESQDSAYPFHDWNERVTADCYMPNAMSLVLDEKSQVERTVNNYSRMSFDFGPTLLKWLEENNHRVYAAVLQADREGMRRFGGHGPAMAQCYNHTIMPLANLRDKRTQVVWGVEDFKLRFGRAPEGMWLPETAVDLETLGVLADCGIKFTVVAPRQVARVRRLAGGPWQDVSVKRVDTSRPYLVKLDRDRAISVFFYDSPISHAVAFEGLLHSGHALADRLTSAHPGRNGEPALVHIATDGESYGHHHRFGDMALAKASDEIEARGSARLTVYGEYLALQPAEWEAEIIENSSWSCVHGVERWRSACGCNAGRNPAWRQEWRAPLRESFDWLRDALALRFEAEGEKLVRDPWAARDAYISVILDRSPSNVEAFLDAHARKQFSVADKVRVLKLFEIQRHAQLMYTSCGWFFDEVSGIETTQVLQYAGRAVQLHMEVFGESLQDELVRRLSAAKSNIPERSDGGAVFREWVKPMEAGLLEAGAHYVLRSLVEQPGGSSQVYSFDVESLSRTVRPAGRSAIATGRIRVTSRITLEQADLDYAALRESSHILGAWVLESSDRRDLQSIMREAEASLAASDFEGVGSVFDSHFNRHRYATSSLFKDERQAVMGRAFSEAITDSSGVFQAFYQQEAPAMRALISTGAPLPGPFRAAAEFYIDLRLKEAISTPGHLDELTIRALIAEAESMKAALDSERLGYLVCRRLRRMFEEFASDPDTLDGLRRLCRAVGLAVQGPWPIDLREVQGLFLRWFQDCYASGRRQAEKDHPAQREWASYFEALGALLSVRLA